MRKLNTKRLNALSKPGMYADGAGLYLNIAKGGTKSWIFRATIKGRVTAKGTPLRTEVGLGSLDILGLAEARHEAHQLRIEAKAGRDPKAKRDYRKMTFEEAAREKHQSLANKFRNDKHRAQWISSLENHAFSKIGKRYVADIEQTDILKVLNPIWIDMNPTAKRLKQRIKAVFNRAIANGQRTQPNPVDSALDELLDDANHRPKHHAALAWAEVPAFLADLAEREAVAALCLRFVILTATRSGEARLATWDEIDLDARTWIIPANRMKANKEHRVPLSDAAVEVLNVAKGLDTELVFPSPTATKDGLGRPLSVNAFRPLFVRMKRKGMTAHGFRSSFRVWCAESANVDHQVAEVALAHTLGPVERAYQRSDLLEPRRKVMDAWGRYATGQSGDVVELVRA